MEDMNAKVIDGRAAAGLLRAEFIPRIEQIGIRSSRIDLEAPIACRTDRSRAVSISRAFPPRPPT